MTVYSFPKCFVFRKVGHEDVSSPSCFAIFSRPTQNHNKDLPFSSFFFFLKFIEEALLLFRNLSFQIDFLAWNQITLKIPPLLIYLAFTSFWGILFQHLGIRKLGKVLLSPHLTWCLSASLAYPGSGKIWSEQTLSLPFTMLAGRTQILGSKSKYCNSWPADYFWCNK